MTRRHVSSSGAEEDLFSPSPTVLSCEEWADSAGCPTEEFLPASSSSTTPFRAVRRERHTHKHLPNCDQMFHYLDQVPHRAKDHNRSNELAGSVVSPPIMVDKSTCHESEPALIVVRLERRMADVMKQFVTKLKDCDGVQDDVAELARLQSEWDVARRQLSTCSEITHHGNNNNNNNNISIIENHATGDAIQIMVSTNGTTLHGSNRGLGPKTRQIGGCLGDDTVAHLLQDLSSDDSQGTRNGQSAP